MLFWDSSRVERVTVNHYVVGSSPTSRSKKIRRDQGVCIVYYGSNPYEKMDVAIHRLVQFQPLDSRIGSPVMVSGPDCKSGVLWPCRFKSYPIHQHATVTQLVEC